MPARNSQRPTAAAAALTVDRPIIDTLQDQLVELNASDNVPEMLEMLNETKKGKLSHEDRTVVNIVGLLVPFLISSKVSESIKKIEVAVEKNSNNVRLLAYSNERLEQYTRRDNLRLFNFPPTEEGELSTKFIEMAAVLGVEVTKPDINAIHPLPSPPGRGRIIIVRLNSRKVRNDILYSKKAVLNTEGCAFRGVYIQEDLTKQRSKMMKFLKNDENTERIRTSEGRLQVSLKVDKGAGRRVLIENPDDFFKLGIDDVNPSQFGYNDI